MATPLAPDFRDWRAHDHVEPHAHAEGQLLLATHGAMQVRVGGRTLRLCEGDAAWVPPGIVHEAHAEASTAFRGVLVAASASSLLPLRPVPVRASALLLAAVPELTSLRGMRRELAAGLIFDELMGAAGTGIAPPVPADPRWATPCLRALEDLTQPPDLDEAARLTGHSRRNFSRGFRARTGLAWSVWLREARAAHAAALLAAGASVTETALAVGYATPSAFCVAFKRHRGATPAAAARRA